MPVDERLAAEWLRRWDVQQERYLADREERFTVIGDVVEHAVEHTAAGRDRPCVVDLGCGPGSLAVRLAERLPEARVVGVDSDPLLLALGAATAPERVRLVDAWVGRDGWLDALGLGGGVDAAVSTTALHWLPEEQLARTYRDMAAVMRSGAVLVDGDHLEQERPRLAATAQAVRDRRLERSGVLGNEDWRSWWDAAAGVPEFADLLAERERRGATGGWGNGFTLTRHTELLHAAGFSEVGTVWQYGDNYVLVAVR
ncbi:class I SAM-dependent methyltransferase [Streptomonospora salina]|uniref:Trans-aconitate methyltransferase n=1 Tax=Streptomonospora salina TaxID=104205 RepID=A0A841EEG3_9ACTN|nr:class I SAM-dependent methyltransferase [Streptomonospora salina]MBB6000754.1 trans-aconitate methyltransferase [Streptomonospora salina]